MRWQGRDDEAYRRVQELLELPMVVLSLAFVPIILVPVIWDVPAATGAALEGAGWFIWAVFAAEYLTLLWLAPDRWQMVRTHWLDLAIVVLPFLRPLRAGRGLRALRLVTVAGRFTVGLRTVLGRRGFQPFLVAVGVVVASCGVAVWLAERHTAGAQITTLDDALWWAVVTSTTVGYGDVVPATAVGRGIAALLMLTGVGLLSVVTANIAAYFVEESTSEHREVVERLDRIEQLLSDLPRQQLGVQGHERRPGKP